MLKSDPTPWLLAQEGLAAVRARRLLGLERAGDAGAVRAVVRKHERSQHADGSFGGSVLRTAGVLSLLDDLRAGTAGVVERGADYLLGVLEAQPGYGRAKRLRPGALTTPHDLCGFFGPYSARDDAEVVKRGAQEMNAYREFEPLLGPKSPVRWERRGSFDRVGPGSCYSWGLIPLCYVVEALCRAGRSGDARLKPAVNVVLGAQRESGGWCRNLGGGTPCSIHGLRAIGAHPRLRTGPSAGRALAHMRSTQQARRGGAANWWRGTGVFAAIQAAAAFDLLAAQAIIRDGIATVAPRQRRNGSFGAPCAVERVAAVLRGVKALGS